MADLFAGDPHTFSLAQQIACVEREIAQRKHVYPRLIAAGKLTQKKADHELACMQAVLETLKGLA